jgi:hypothetical protein
MTLFARTAIADDISPSSAVSRFGIVRYKPGSKGEIADVHSA